MCGTHLRFFKHFQTSMSVVVGYRDFPTQEWKILSNGLQVEFFDAGKSHE